MVKKQTVHKKENYVMVCPKCNSINISMDNSDPLVGAAGIPGSYYCADCGYTAKVFPEVTEEEAKKLIKKDVPKKEQDTQTNKVDTGYGKFMVSIWWKIIGPLGLISAIIWYLINTKENPQAALISFLMSAIIFVVITYLAYRKK